MSGKEVLLVQDIPVRVLPPSIAMELKEPRLPTPDMAIKLPSLETLRQITDRLKHLNPDHMITLRANQAGQLELISETSSLKVKTEFSGLNMRGNNVLIQRSERYPFTQMQIDVRDFLKILPCSIMHPVMECVFYNSYGLVVKGYVQDGIENTVTLSFHIPIRQT